MNTPLADRLRPKKIEDFIGQEHLIGKGKPIRRMIETGNITSMILWGPPGVGKTTIASLIAEYTDAHFVFFSAVTSGVEDVRRLIKEAKTIKETNDKTTILFVDEIHRFNKAQQDGFLPHVENGTIVLIGATTENPGFRVNAPLISRSQVYVFYSLTNDHLKTIAEKATSFYLKNTWTDEAINHFIETANGDARTLINAIELAASMSKKIDLKIAEEAVQQKAIFYDKKGDYHYDTISSYVKSMRASNVDAALHYLARMVEAGEDALFIARRMVIFASEDIGMAQPTAIVVANGVFRACETIGYPECAINLAHGTVYLAKAKKDRRAYDAYFRAVEDIKKHGNLPIPLKLRNAPTKLMKDLGYGKGYEMYTDEDLLPEKLKGTKYYEEKPDNNR